MNQKLPFLGVFQNHLAISLTQTTRCLILVFLPKSLKVVLSRKLKFTQGVTH